MEEGEIRMVKVVCHYGLHFSEITGKFEETVEFEGNRLRDLLEVLDGRYHGRFKKEMIAPGTDALLTRNAVLLERANSNTGPVFSLDSELQNGDRVTFF